jgi:hypothetical protein
MNLSITNCRGDDFVSGNVRITASGELEGYRYSAQAVLPEEIYTYPALLQELQTFLVGVANKRGVALERRKSLGLRPFAKVEA